MELDKQTDWQKSDTHVFWGEIAPTDHVVQIYESDAAFLDLLEGYVAGGLRAHECAIVIATAAHLSGLKDKLRAHGFDVPALCADDQLILLDAEEILSKFMVKEWPDEILFYETISNIIKRAKARRRQVRAFGEMVALLWAKGLSGATVQLENLWNRFCQTEDLCLFCAYPKSGFTQDAGSSLTSICCSHSKLISGEHTSKAEVFYKSLAKMAG